jgi:hypothetical protein
MPTGIVKFCFGLLWLFAGGTALARTGYALKIDDQGYRLQIEMQFLPGQTLQEVSQGLRSGPLLARLSSSVRAVNNIPAEGLRYDSFMEVRSWGVTSYLLSHCEESEKAFEWSRRCVLDTHQKDGGSYMETKTDEVTCRVADALVQCHFEILGKAKPLKLFSLTILDPKRFAVKAKYEALTNFFKLYHFIEDGGFSVKTALKDFENSPEKADFEIFQNEANSVLEKESNYGRSFYF